MNSYGRDIDGLADVLNFRNSAPALRFIFSDDAFPDYYTHSSR